MFVWKSWAKPFTFFLPEESIFAPRLSRNTVQEYNPVIFQTLFVLPKVLDYGINCSN